MNKHLLSQKSYFKPKRSVLGVLAVGVLSFQLVVAPASFAQADLDDYLTQIAGDDDQAPANATQDKLGMGGTQIQVGPQNSALEAAVEPASQPIFGEAFQAVGDIVPVPAAQNNQRNIANDGDALPNIPDLTTRSSAAGMNLPVQDNMRLDVSGMGLDEKSPAELEEEIRREAFDAAITGLFPLTPDNIKVLLTKQDEVARATEEPINGIPTPKINVETISLDPGVEPMVITTSAGFITTLNILDVTGAPWPIQDVSWAGDFEIIEPEEGGHIIRITPLGHSAFGNMSIRMLTLKTPITIQLKTDKDSVQYRVDARIPEYGPFATTPLIDGGSERVAGDANIMSVLDGIAPKNAEKMYVSGVDARTSAYKYNNMTYVRTPLTLISPSWDQSVSSADGMHVYALNDTPVILLSDNGRLTRVNLSLVADDDNE